MHEDVSSAEIHTAIGPMLANLHAVQPNGLARWPLADRLRAFLTAPPVTCPASLAADVARMVESLVSLVSLVREEAFVHGDWGTANVLVRPGRPTDVLAIIDFEDAHVGDPAEDFKWQVLAGPKSEELVAGDWPDWPAWPT